MLCVTEKADEMDRMKRELAGARLGLMLTLSYTLQHEIFRITGDCRHGLSEKEQEWLRNKGREHSEILRSLSKFRQVRLAPK